MVIAQRIFISMNRQDIFAYGNIGEDPEIFKIYPQLLSETYRYFSFEASRFNVEPSKISSARVCMCKELGIPFVYTIACNLLLQPSALSMSKFFNFYRQALTNTVSCSLISF